MLQRWENPSQPAYGSKFVVVSSAVMCYYTKKIRPARDLAPLNYPTCALYSRYLLILLVGLLFVDISHGGSHFSSKGPGVTLQDYLQCSSFVISACPYIKLSFICSISGKGLLRRVLHCDPFNLFKFHWKNNPGFTLTPTPLAKSVKVCWFTSFPIIIPEL